MEGKKSLAYPGEKNHDRTRSPQLCAELEVAEHELRVYARERPTDWAKAVGMPNR